MVEISYLKSAVLFLLIFAFAYVLRRFPPVLPFILSGFVAKFFIPSDEITHLSLFDRSAVFILFFFIGLEFSFEKLRHMVNIWIPGFIEFLFCFLLPIPFFLKLGYEITSSTLLALLIYPTSSVIFVKLILDSKRAGFPETEFLIGLLIFQDIVSVIILSFVLPLHEYGEVDFTNAFYLIIKILLVFVIFVFLLKYLPFRLFDDIAESDSFIFFIWGIILFVGFLSERFGVLPALSTFLLGVLIPEKSKMYERILKEFSVFRELSIGLFFFFFTFKLDLDKFVIRSDVILLVVAIFVVSMITKIPPIYIGGRLSGLDRPQSLRGAFSFFVRGEFSVLVIDFVNDAVIKTAGTIYVFLSIIFGVIMFILAPSISRILRRIR